MALPGGLDFLGAEEEAVARLAHHSQVASRIVIHDHRQVGLAFVVLLDAFDGCGLAI